MMGRSKRPLADPELQGLLPRFRAVELALHAARLRGAEQDPDLFEERDALAVDIARLISASVRVPRGRGVVK